MPRSARRTAVVLGGAGVVAALAVGALWITGAGSTTPGRTDAAAPDGQATAPAWTSAPQASPVRAENGGGPVATDPAPATAGGAVRVTVTQAGWGQSGSGVEVTGFVGGVVEDGGTCRATLTHDGETVTAKRAGLADASTTACGVLEVGTADMSSGWWEATLSYKSATSSGVSKPVAVLVPTR